MSTSKRSSRASHYIFKTLPRKGSLVERTSKMVRSRREPAPLSRFALTKVPPTTYAEVICLAVTFGDDPSREDFEAELEELRIVLQAKFHYGFQRWRLRTFSAVGPKQCESALYSRMRQFALEYGGENNLLMLYYSGHGGRRDGQDEFFLAG